MPGVTGSIFFVEDVGEAVYKWDRYFVQLREIGLFDKIAGFLLGQTTDCTPPEDEPSLTMDDLMRHFVKPLKIPALANLDYGHGRVKYTMPIGVRADLEVSAKRTRVAIVEAAVV